MRIKTLRCFLAVRTSITCFSSDPRSAARLIPTEQEQTLVEISPSLNTRLPELRNLIEAARAYIDDQTDYSRVCVAAAALRDTLKRLPTNPAIKALSAEWVEMASRVWPEFGRISNPVSEPEFRAWVAAQLTVFEPFDCDRQTRHDP